MTGIGIFWVDFAIGLVYVNIHKAILRPTHDPGITIWWLCCIKLGQTGKYAKSMTKERRKKSVNQKKEIMAKLKNIET